MKRRTEKGSGKQAGTFGERLGQLLLPMVAGIATTKEDLLEWVHGFGLAALGELLGEQAEALAGPKGKHRSARTHNHWGRTVSELTFGGRRIAVERPRVRTVDGREAWLPALQRFSERDPLPERVLRQILLGVSTRGYDASLEPRPAGHRTRGSSKSSASRALVSKTRERMKESLEKRLDGLDLVALFIDGLEVAGRTIVVALGVAMDGTKVPLGLAQGSTENAALCTTMLQGLFERGLKINGRLLCVIDGGKGIRKALEDVFGDLAVVQRCQAHKLRNLRAHLPQERQGHVISAMRDAYRCGSVAEARKKLRALVAWLDAGGFDDAAASLREGLEETLTVLKLGLPSSLRRFFATTNAIENLIGSVRTVTRNVKRWRGGDMVRRWVALGLQRAGARFRRIRGHHDLPALVRALRANDAEKERVA
jgi:putative transposase